MFHVTIERKNIKQKKEFSKKIITRVGIIAALTGILVPLSVMFLELPETIGCALIAAVGSVSLTSIVFYYKKAQAENTIKLYLNSYSEILKLKKKYGDEVNLTLEEIETNMLNKISNTLDNSIEDATSPIEGQSIG